MLKIFEENMNEKNPHNPRFRRYPEYKDSDVEWIGKIPKHWNLVMLKYKARLVYGDSLISENREDGVVPVYGSNGIIDSHCSANTLSPTIIVGRKGSLGKVQYSDVPCFVIDTAYYIDKRTSKVNLLWLYYVLQTLKLERFRNSVLPGLNRESAETQHIPLIRKEEQTQIANFLDRKTQQIDELIRIKERQVELLQEQRTALINQAVTKGLDPNVEMKPSGVEWIGEIPAHWEVKRIKYLASVISKGTTPTTIGREIFDEGEIRFIKVENIVDNQIELKPENYIDAETNQMLKRSQLKENDLLFVIAGATIGKVSLVKLSNLPANTNQAISFIRLHEKDLPEFVYYWLQSDNIQKIIWLNAVQSAQPNLSMEDLGNLYIPYPSIAEQHRIVNHITDKTQTIVQLLQQTYKQIQLLKEYRQSLISEAVTGKIDVRNGI